MTVESKNYVKNPMESTKKLLELLSGFNNVSVFKVSIQV